MAAADDSPGEDLLPDPLEPNDPLEPRDAPPFQAEDPEERAEPWDPPDSAGASPELEQLGEFEVVEEIGRGGMGVVYKARQPSEGRYVALKVLPSFAGLDPATVERFQREAEATSQLAHPGILPVYAVGEADGTHYFAMELVEGPSLAELIAQLRGRVPGRMLRSLAEETGIDETFPAMRDFGDPSATETRYAQSCAALIADIAGALTVAHDNRIIHRDVKPNNLMIRGDGRPVILDFGLARDERSLGSGPAAVGTPLYMAPEQAAGRRDVDARADIYGLGVTLYELLTLRVPFEGTHTADTIRMIVEDEPAPVRSLNPRVSEDLENIVLACLAKHPDARYASAEQLEIDLRAYLSGREVEARTPTRKERAAQFLKRNRQAAVVGVIAVGRRRIDRNHGGGDPPPSLGQARPRGARRCPRPAPRREQRHAGSRPARASRGPAGRRGARDECAARAGHRRLRALLPRG